MQIKNANYYYLRVVNWYKMNDKSILSKKLQTLIKVKFKQQKVFAKELNINEGQVGRWIKGSYMPNLETLYEIANYCNLPISYFFEEDAKADSQTSINEEIFNEVFALAFDFAKKNNLEIKGSLFLGCYDLVVEQKNKDNSKEIKEIFEDLKPFLLRLWGR